MVLGLAAAGARPAAGCDRVRVPASVASADADVIAVVVPTEVRGQLGEDRAVEVAVERVLKGRVGPGTAKTVRRSIDEICGAVQLEVGKRYLAFFRQRAAGLEWTSDGAAAHTPAAEQEVAELAGRLPTWSPPRRGLAVIAVPEKLRIAAGEDLVVWMLYRNVSSKPVKISYRDWPEKKASRWTAEVRGPDGSPVRATPHPTLTRPAIVDYFPKHGQTWTLEIQPGETFPLAIDRLNTARPGWGYKERLGFRFYPMEAPGRYSVTLTGHKLGSEARPFEVEVTPPASR